MTAVGRPRPNGRSHLSKRSSRAKNSAKKSEKRPSKKDLAAAAMASAPDAAKVKPARSLSRKSKSKLTRDLIQLYLHDARHTCANPSKADKKVLHGMRSNPVRISALVEPHLFYVVQLAGEYRSSRTSFEDLLAAGNMGLVEAAHHFDPDRGVKFLTYATWWIRKRMLDLLARDDVSVRLTRYARDRRRALLRIEDDLRAALGREPSSEELANAASMDVHQVVTLKHAKPSLLPIDAAKSDEERRVFELPDKSAWDPESLAQNRELSQEVRRLVAELSPRARAIIEARFGLGGDSARTFEELGTKLGISRERARQIERESLTKLRRRLARQLRMKRVTARKRWSLSAESGGNAAVGGMRA